MRGWKWHTISDTIDTNYKRMNVKWERLKVVAVVVNLIPKRFSPSETLTAMAFGKMARFPVV